MSTATHCYVGTCPCCGNVPDVTVDDPDNPKLTAKYVGAMVRYGLTVTRVPLDDLKGTPIRRCAKRQAELDAKAARKSARQGALL